MALRVLVSAVSPARASLSPYPSCAVREVLYQRIHTRWERFATVFAERPTARVFIEALTESARVARCVEEWDTRSSWLFRTVPQCMCSASARQDRPPRCQRPSSHLRGGSVPPSIPHLSADRTFKSTFCHSPFESAPPGTPQQHPLVDTPRAVRREALAELGGCTHASAGCPCPRGRGGWGGAALLMLVLDKPLRTRYGKSPKPVLHEHTLAISHSSH